MTNFDIFDAIPQFESFASVAVSLSVFYISTPLPVC